MDTHVATHALALTRLLPAAPEAVFAAFTDPAQIPLYWAPAGMTATEAAVDLRPGGFHEVLMRSAGGEEFRVRMILDAVEAPRRLVMRVPEGGCCPLPGATGEISFEPDPAGTRLEILWRHPTAAMRDQHETMGFARCWHEMLDKLTAHLTQPAVLCPGTSAPQAAHGWLHRLLGTWTYETEMPGKPGEPAQVVRGVERVRSLGGYWVVGETEGECPGMGGHARMIVTMGWDAAAQRFRGTWVGSMMPHMFVYEGTLSEDGTTLSLDSEGPSFDGSGTAQYRDVVELRDADTRIVTCQVRQPDGSWMDFMTNRFRRQA